MVKLLIDNGMKDWWQATFPKGRQTLIITDAKGYPVQISYGEKGRGKPLILLHGMGSWSYNWRHSVTELSKYFRVICFDAKGFGFSENHCLVENTTVIKLLSFKELFRHYVMNPQ